MCVCGVNLCSYTDYIYCGHRRKKNEVLSLKEFRENYPSLKVLFRSVPAQVLGNDN